MNPVPGELIAAAFRRDLGACVCCGTAVTARAFSVRRRNPHAGDCLSNLLTFLGDGSRHGDPADHAARVSSGLDLADAARGFAVPSGHDPALVPVLVSSSRLGEVLMWLDETESYATVPPEGAEAA
jgi:hypothetical protein